MNLNRIYTIVKTEIKRLFNEPIIFIFTILLAPALIGIFGVIMGSNYGWGEDYSIFEIMLPGLLAYGSLLTTYDVAASFAGDRETGIQARIQTTPLSSGEYLLGQMIAYTIKPLIQLILGLGVAFLVGFNAQTPFLGYVIIALFLILLTFVSVGFGMITATFAKTGNTAGGLSFIFIVPQQIFATFIPPVFLGFEKFAWFLPSFYATDGIGKTFVASSLMDREIWLKMGILFLISIVVYAVGITIQTRRKDLTP